MFCSENSSINGSGGKSSNEFVQANVKHNPNQVHLNMYKIISK